MILLDPANRILEETVKAVVELEEGAKRDICDVRLYDFDDISYRVHNDKDAIDVLHVSMNVPCFHQFKEEGGQEALEKYYKDLYVEPETGYDVTLKVDLAAYSGDKGELTKKLSLLRCNVMGGLFEHYLVALQQDKSSEMKPKKVDLRGDTTVYFVPKADRVVIVFAVDFADKVDKTVAKVFLQEFVDAKRSLGRAPPCNWGADPPLELGEFGVKENQGNLGYISFAVLKSHVTEKTLPQAVRVLQGFRAYIQYHLKCSKTLFHSKMRARIKSLLQVLNRAKMENEDEEKAKKTASGKTWKRG